MNELKEQLLLFKRKIAEESFESALSTTVPAILYDIPSGLIIKSTKPADKLFNADLENRPLTDIIPDRFHQAHAEHIKHFSNAAIDRPMGSGMNIIARKIGGDEFTVEIILHPITSDQVLATILPK